MQNRYNETRSNQWHANEKVHLDASRRSSSKKLFPIISWLKLATHQNNGIYIDMLVCIPQKKNKLELWRTLCAFSPFLKGGLFMFVCVFSRQVLDFLLAFLVLSFPVSLIFCFPCFSACCFPCFSAFLLFAFLLLCFSASLFSLLLCFCTYVPFYFYYSTFFQQCVFCCSTSCSFASLLPVFIVSLFLIFFCFNLFCLHPTWNPRETLGET